MMSWFGRWRRILIVATALPVLGFVYVAGDTFLEDDNFRVVTPELFRSGQLRADEWNESLAEHGYRSVLNLRGARPGRDWYEYEQRFAAAHGLTHYDFELTASVSPSVADMKRIVEIMRDAPKPLLIHCAQGADRSGLVAGLYRLAIEGAGLPKAQGQLSLWYGHFPWLTSKTGAMDRALDHFARCAADPDAPFACPQTDMAMAEPSVWESRAR